MGNALEVPENLAIRQGTGLFEAAVDASTEGLALAEQGLICYANPAFVRLLGLSEPSQVIGHPWASLRPVGSPCLRMPGQEGNCENSHLCHGDKLLAARMLGIGKTTLYRSLRRRFRRSTS